MFGLRSVCIALIALATAGCGAGSGPRSIPSPETMTQKQNAGEASLAATRASSSRRAATPEPLATGLVDPTAVELQGPRVFVGDVGTLDRVPRAGGNLVKVLTGTSIFDSGSFRGINRIAFNGQRTVIVGFGGYLQYNVVESPISTGAQTLLATLQGGYLVGVIGTDVYYARGFNTIERLPLAGGPAQTVASGVWVRTVKTDETAAYFVDYWTRDVKKFDAATSTLTTLISGNPLEGGIVIDTASVYLSQATTIQKVSKSGGPVTTIYSGTAPLVIAVDDEDVFFLEGSDLKAVPSVGGTARTITSGMIVNAAAAGDRYLFFTDVSHGVGAAVLYRIRTGA